MKLLLGILFLLPNLAFAYQAYWTDALVRRFGEGGKDYDQEILRVGASYSQGSAGIWGKLDSIQNDKFGSGLAGDLGGLYRYGSLSTTAGVGYSDNFSLRASRLYLIEQRLYTLSDRLIPVLGFVREEYLGAPQSYYDFYRAGLTGVVTSKIMLSGQVQMIENSFSSTATIKKGYGIQLMGLYQEANWLAQAGVIRNCLGSTGNTCDGTRDLYEEWLTNGHWGFAQGWFLRGGFSYIKQSSRFVAPFSAQVVGTSTVSSQLYSLGIMRTLP